MKWLCLFLLISLPTVSLFAEIQFVKPRFLTSKEAILREPELTLPEFRDSIQKLEIRLQSIHWKPCNNALTSFQQSGWLQWLTHWIGQNKNRKTALSDNDTLSLIYATEIITHLESCSELPLRNKQLPSRETFHLNQSDQEKKPTSFNYVLRIPEQNRDTYPLLLIVHGYSHSPNISGGIRKEIEAASQGMDFPFITAAVIFNGDMRLKGGWDPDELAGFVESLSKKLPIDQSRIYITGFSMGAHGIIRTATKRPDLFAAIAPLCGRADPESAAALKNLPVYLYHGDQDDSIMRPELSLKFHNELSAYDADVTLFIYEGVGHNVWSEVYRDPAFYERLLQHQKTPYSSEN